MGRPGGISRAAPCAPCRSRAALKGGAKVEEEKEEEELEEKE